MYNLYHSQNKKASSYWHCGYQIAFINDIVIRTNHLIPLDSDGQLLKPFRAKVPWNTSLDKAVLEFPKMTDDGENNTNEGNRKAAIVFHPVPNVLKQKGVIAITYFKTFTAKIFQRLLSIESKVDNFP